MHFFPNHKKAIKLSKFIRLDYATALLHIIDVFLVFMFVLLLLHLYTRKGGGVAIYMQISRVRGSDLLYNKRSTAYYRKDLCYMKSVKLTYVTFHKMVDPNRIYIKFIKKEKDLLVRVNKVAFYTHYSIFCLCILFLQILLSCSR